MRSRSQLKSPWRFVSSAARAMIVASTTRAYVRSLERVRSAEVGTFFTIYARIDGLWLAPARLEGPGNDRAFGERRRFETQLHDVAGWRDGRISFIRDYLFVTSSPGSNWSKLRTRGAAKEACLASVGSGAYSYRVRRRSRAYDTHCRALVSRVRACRRSF